MRARRLQEAFTKYTAVLKSGERFEQPKMKDTCYVFFNDCSSLYVPETTSQLDSWRNFLDLKPENEGGNLFSSDAAING